MELKDTVDGMLSDDYKERFKAEYDQLMIRASRLEKLLIDDSNGDIDFELQCPRQMLGTQLRLMRQLLEVLKRRAKIESIDLK